MSGTLFPHVSSELKRGDQAINPNLFISNRNYHSYSKQAITELPSPFKFFLSHFKKKVH